MGRSRKDSRRRITIDGVVYRYRVSPDDGFIALIARPEGSRRQLLWVGFEYHDDWVPVGGGAFTSAGHRLHTAVCSAPGDTRRAASRLESDGVKAGCVPYAGWRQPAPGRRMAPL